MIYSLSGKLLLKKPQFVVINVGGAGFRVSVSEETLRSLPKINSKINLFCSLKLQREQFNLYGFRSERELEFFDLLTSINGIGAKAALRIMGITKIDNLLNAIKQGRTDILIKASGVGRKKANRIVMEIQDKFDIKDLKDAKDFMAENAELEKVLKGLGYSRNDIRETVGKIPRTIKKLEDKIKLALKFLSKNG